MTIRHAKREETDEIMRIYSRARAFMAENGNATQWVNYPPRELLLSDIDREELYVCEQGGAIAAVFMYSERPEPTYGYIDGAWQNDLPYGVVHRIASAGIVKGAGRHCLEWAIEKCKNLRIDTHRDNAPMQNLLNSLGFKYCGIIYLENNDERIAFQKTIE